MLRAVSSPSVEHLVGTATCLYSSIALNLLGSDLLGSATVAILYVDLPKWNICVKKRRSGVRKY